MASHTQGLDDSILVGDNLIAQNPALVIADTVRLMGSTLLRFTNKPWKLVTLELPPHFGFLEPLHTIYSNHDLLPEAPQGHDVWELVPLLVVEVTDPLTVGDSPVVLKVLCVDLRDVYCTVWAPLQTEIGMTDDLNGIAFITRGGGWQTWREQVGYGIRPPGNDSYQEVRANTPIVDAFGLQAEGGDDVSRLLNSAFSEGTGATFTNWTPTTSGGAFVAEIRQYTLIDANGFRRSPQLVTTAAGEACYLTQTVNGQENKALFVRVWYKDGGAFDRMGLRIQRSDTSEYLDSAGAWQVAVQTISLTPGSGVLETLRYVTPMFDTTSGGTVNLTIRVGHFSAVANTTQISQPQGIELLESPGGHRWDGFRSPLPTKAAAVTRVWNKTALRNDSATRVLSPTRGFVKLRAVPAYSHADLDDGSEKVLLSADFDGAVNTSWFRLYYTRIDGSTGQWRFQNFLGDAAVLEVTGGDLLVAGQVYTVITRWTSEAHDEHGLTGQALDVWVDGVRGTTLQGAATQAIDAASWVYLGSAPNIGELASWDGHIRALKISDHCPSEAVLLRV